MSDSPTIFVWNPGLFSDRVRSEGHCVVNSRKELERARRTPKFRDAPIVLLAEWISDGRRMSDFDGLRLLIELFESQSQVPRVALCSFASREALAGLGDEREDAARLMFPFVRLPASLTDLADAAANAPAPSSMVQVWLRDHVLSPRPLAMWEHNFNRDAGVGLAGFRAAVMQLSRQVSARRSLLARTFSDLAAFETLLDDAARAADEADESRMKELRLLIQAELATAQRRTNATSGATPEPYSVLVVEDDEAQREVIVNSLEKYFAHVAAFHTADAALRVLAAASVESSAAEPMKSRVSAIVSDWDLRDDGKSGGFMQRVQGPDFLVKAGEYCAGPLVGLTSLPSDVVSGILNAAPADVRARLSWFPKRRSLTGTELFDFQSLAHHILSGIRVSERLLEETPAASGKTHWSKRGLGDHYVAVRSWSQEKQTAFFAECARRSLMIVEAYANGAQTVDVSGPIFDLNINVPSGDMAGRPHSFQRFKDVLCGRLAVLVLYARLPHRERSYVRVLGRLHPEMWDEHQPERVPSSFHNMMSMLGIGTIKKTRIDLAKLKFMPHESAWLLAHGIDLVRPALTPEERHAATDFKELADTVVRQLERDLELEELVIDQDELDEPVDLDSPEDRAGEAAVRTIEEGVAFCLRSTLGHEAVRRAKARYKRAVGELVHDNGDLLDVLYARFPDWKERLVQVTEQL